MRFLRARAQRGAALAETALVVGVILIMILGSVQLGVVGYIQMTADAASFMSAHQTVLGDPNAITATTGVFPQFAPLDFTPSAAPAPVPTVGIDYGYNDPNPILAAASINNRHGGASMMEPTQLGMKVAKPNVVSLLGVPLNVEGSMVEPQWLENGAHFDVANSASYGQTGPANFQENYFTNGENTPPYFVGFNFIENCPDAQPWPTAQTGCALTAKIRALGVAEHLDDSIWERPNGEIPNPLNPQPLPLAFAQVACHQQVFSILATFFANNSSLGALQTPVANNGLPISPMGDGDYANWAPFGGGPAGGPTGFGAAPAGAVQGSVTGAQADAAIQRIYSWDLIVTAGTSSSTGVGSIPFPPAYGAGAQSVGHPYVYGTNC